jgi:hypothetical protein
MIRNSDKVVFKREEQGEDISTFVLASPTSGFFTSVDFVFITTLLSVVIYEVHFIMLITSLFVITA